MFSSLDDLQGNTNMEFTDSCYISIIKKPFNVLFEIAQEIEFMPQYTCTILATCCILHTPTTMLSHDQTTTEDKSE
jgi:hypothetical protein